MTIIHFDNKKISWDDIHKIIEFAQKVHSNLRNKIDPDVEDRKHAIWLLQGLIITSATLAFEFNLRGIALSASQQQRLIGEAIELILFFEQLDDNSRQLRAWFNDYIVSRNEGSVSVDKRTKISGLSAEQIKASDNLHKKISEFWSKYMHPSLRVTRTNLYKKIYIFDYNHTDTPPSLSEDEFIRFFVLKTIQCLILPARLLTPSLTDYQTLDKYRNILS